MKTINIKEKLEEIDVPVESLVLGDFDFIGKFTAERVRDKSDPNFKKYGAFYRSNYERGILIYHLIRQFKLTSFLEIGFGRGYATFCAAKAFHDSGVQGEIVTVDPNFDEQLLQALTTVFDPDWFKMVQFMKGPSEQVLPQVNRNFDLIYIDGDHSYHGTKLDWELCKEKFDSFLLFDDYHMPDKNDPGIQCSQLIDEIEDDSKELIVMDRRIFFDDRRFTDDQINYGQVLLTKPTVERDDW